MSIPSELAGYTMPHSSGDREKKILAGDDSARLESACVFFLRCWRPLGSSELLLVSKFEIASRVDPSISGKFEIRICCLSSLEFTIAAGCAAGCALVHG